MRNVFYVIVCFVCTGIFSNTHAAKPKIKLSEPDKSVLVLYSPNVDAQLAKRNFGFMQRNVRGTLQQDNTLLRVKDFAPKEQLKIFSAMRSDKNVLVVVMINSSDSHAPIVIYSTSMGAAVVNIAPIVRDKQLSDKVKSAVIDRSMMYALGRVAGMDACLNPYCALSEYKQLPKKQLPGRNYCPNCIDKVGEKLQALGAGEAVAKRPAVK